MLLHTSSTHFSTLNRSSRSSNEGSEQYLHMSTEVSVGAVVAAEVVDVLEEMERWEVTDHSMAAELHA